MELLKFLIADDEENIRNGLKFIIDWEKCGYKFCGEASNGKDSVSQIIDLQPDLVILDIKMPGLTGIEVISQVTQYFIQKEIPIPAFIILSGFSEFEYAKDALNKGAKAYLLKPVDEDQLEKTVISIAKEIHAKKSLEETSTNAKLLQTKEFLKNLLNEENVDNIKKQADSNFFDDAETSNYQAIIFSMKYYPNVFHDELKKSIYNYFSFFTKIIQTTKESIIVILKTKNETAVYNSIERAAKLHLSRTFITCGQNLQGLDGIVESYSQAKENLKYLFYFGNKNCIKISDIEISNTDTEKTIQNYITESLEKLIFCIETYDKKTLESVVEKFNKMFMNISFSESETKKNMIYTLVELRNRLVAKYPEREITDGATFDVVQKILEIKTFEEAFNYFENVLYDFLENFNFNTADSVIVKVLAYIKNNYSEDLKLENLGEMFNCNSAYLGKKFKKYTGMQFNTYLDNLRIEDAKDKLLHSDLKIYQISKLVGYINTDYFFMKFKKQTGMTPKEFKKSQGVENESEE